MTDDKKKLTTDVGAPVYDNQNSMTAGPRGPLLLQDVWFLEKLGFRREGAAGTEDVSRTGPCCAGSR